MIRFRCPRIAFAAALLVPATAAGADGPVEAVTLRYQGYVAGAAVGEAQVDVAVTADGYRVRGDARSNNWLKGFTDWRNVFSAAGVLADGERRPRRFEYTETDRDKSRHLLLEDGTISVTKNGRARPPRPAPGYLDVVSALFVEPRCSPVQTLHTGRHVYTLKRLDNTSTGCRYRVTDDDGDAFEMALELGVAQGLVVPDRITVHGWLTGWVERVTPGPAQGE